MLPTWPNHHDRNRQQPISVGGRVGIVARPPPGSLREPPSPLQGEEKRICLTFMLNVDLAVIRTTPGQLAAGFFPGFFGAARFAAGGGSRARPVALRPPHAEG